MALAEDPELWEVYEGGDERLLFRREDYADPEHSKLFADLVKREALSEWIHRLVAVCHGPYAAIPAPADFLAGHFDYARFVPGGPRPLPAVVAAAPPPSVVPPPAPPQAPAPSRPLAAQAALLRRFDFVTPAIIIAVLAVAAIFHDAILHFAFPGPPPAQTDSADGSSGPAKRPARPAHPRVAVERSGGGEHPAHSPPAPVAERAANAAPPATRTPAPPETSGPAPVAKPARAPDAKPVHRPATAGAASAGHAHAAEALVPSERVAPNARPAHRPADATSGLLDAAAGDVAGTPKCTTPDTPAHVLSGAVPVVSKYGAVSGGGAADVSVSLTASGQVTGASIAASSGSADLDAAALDAARRSSYSPELLNCSHVASSVNLHVRF